MTRALALQIDTQIMQHARAGEVSEAAKLLVRHYSPFVYATALRYIKDEVEAEDITQEVMIKAVEKLSGFRNESLITTWLYRITVNKSARAIRKQKFR